MRLFSVILRNYRLHRELKLNFDRTRTLIGGPNESGKSTLVEAVHRALFLKCKGNTEYHRAMTSSLHTGHPEVELSFEVGNARYVLKKRFGATGTVTLLPSNLAALTGDAAEAELARLLGLEAGVTGRAIITQWAHLWVWQGMAGENPSTHATTQREGLLQRLQALGGAVALQSELDSRVARHFAELRDRLFTQGNKPKAGSPLVQAEQNVETATQELAQAELRLAQLETAAKEFELAVREEQAAHLSLVELNKNHDATEERAKQLVLLRQQESEQTHTAKETTEQLKRLSSVDEKILTIRIELASLEKSLAPQKLAVAEAESLRDAAKMAATSSELAHRSSAEHARLARLNHDLAAAHAVRHERSERLERLRDKVAKVGQKRLEAEQLDQRLARLPKLTTARLRKLQERESEHLRARATLQAMATGIEIVAASGEVTAGAQSVLVGQRCILTEDTELRHGSDFCVRIQPGGGTRLADARQAEQQALEDLKKDLDSLEIASVSVALEVHAEREELSARVKAARSELDGMSAEKVEEELLQAQRELAASAASLARLAELAPDLPAPDSLPAALALSKARADLRSDAEAKEMESRSLRDQALKVLEATEDTWRRRRTETEQLAARVTGTKAQLDLLLQTHGDDGARATALAEARVVQAAAELRRNATAAAVAALQPELLEADVVRVRRALERTTNDRNEARTRAAIAQAALRSDGNEDPRAAVAAARARCQSATEHAQNIRRKAEAVALLDDLFREEQRSLGAKFTQPLADKISGYLQCLFGSGARAQVSYEDEGFTGLQLTRGDLGGATFTFDSLSGGAREQTAAAVRLAMAELLAGDHGGCLPVVFDDAFAYSDPERVNQLQRMLDLAASRGLQVIVLTCNPADYAALGAHTISIKPE